MIESTVEYNSLRQANQMREKDWTPDFPSEFSDMEPEPSECLAEKLADLIISADSIAAKAGIDLSKAVEDRFNETSERNGLRHRLRLLPQSASYEEMLPGDVDPHDDIERSVRVVRRAYQWLIATDGTLCGLVAGDMGYESTHIRLDLKKCGMRWCHELTAYANNASSALEQISASMTSSEKVGSSEHNALSPDAALNLAVKTIRDLIAAINPN